MLKEIIQQYLEDDNEAEALRHLLKFFLEKVMDVEITEQTGAIPYQRALDLEDNLLEDVSPLRDLTALESLHLDNNFITDIQPLVKATELNSIWYLDLRYNYLDLTDNSTDMKNIKVLKDRGIWVEYRPQRSP